MTEFKIKQTELSETLEQVGDPAGLIRWAKREEMDITETEIRRGSLQEADFSQLVFENVRFDHCIAEQAAMKNCTFRNVVFQGWPVSRMRFFRKLFRSVQAGSLSADWG